MQIYINYYNTETGFYNVDVISYDQDFNQCNFTCYMEYDQLIEDKESIINPDEI